MPQYNELNYDYIIIGSGFGGSVAALRLSEKGYKVLVLEKGKWHSAENFPKTTWNIKKYFWLPVFRCFGFFKLNFFRHVTILAGTGVGGGSLVYANCLQTPQKDFFQAESWSYLADWQSELKEFYQTGNKMMGASPNPRLELGDKTLKKIAVELGKEEGFKLTDVGVFFGEPDITVADPYFNGKGPDRCGCNFCGGCMVGCRYNAKNSLDKNYLYLAQKNGVSILAEKKVYDLIPLAGDGSKGYKIKWKSSISFFKKKGEVTAKNVILAGGVLGTIPLLLNLKKSTMPKLSDRLGYGVRTNSESFIGVMDYKRKNLFSDGIAIGSIFHTDRYSHVEPVRYSAGSGFWRLLIAPLVRGQNVFVRIMKLVWDLISSPLANFRMYFVDDFAKRTQILMYMQTLDSTLRFSKSVFGMKSSMDSGKSPSAFIPEANQIAERFAEIVDGKTGALITETLLGKPTTAHILGGAVMGENEKSGVIDKNNRVFGYKNFYICDGSMISANPGVNPALTIIALTERAMSKIPGKEGVSV